jgi:hypothetical protein
MQQQFEFIEKHCVSTFELAIIEKRCVIQDLSLKSVKHIVLVFNI